MIDTTLVVMAGGIGSRYKGGIKQLEPFGPNGEILMEYSIHDAIEAGFNKVIIILREDILLDFKENIGKRIENKIKVEYVIQSVDCIPIKNSIKRTKPWGTGHAVLACKDKIDEPFCVINADDYYGIEGFKLIHDFLINDKDDNTYCIISFILKNTLSSNGSVKRGICKVDSNDYLIDIKETFDIELKDNVINSNNGILNGDTKVSMNMFGFKPSMLEYLEDNFITFLNDNLNLDSEYLLPTVVNDLLKQGKIKVRVFSTSDRWFGITYNEDYLVTKEALNKLYEEGKYQSM